LGQKVNPTSFRLQVNKDWRSKWFIGGKKQFAATLDEDIKIRRLIEKKFETRAVINRIDIERAVNQTTITVWTAKAGIVIGKGGAGAKELQSEIAKITKTPIRLNIEEVKRPDLAAKIVAENIARQIEPRINFRRAAKQRLQNVMMAGAKGVRIEIAGRLNGAEMTRREKFIDGSVSLHTLRNDIDYHLAVAKTPAGTIGIKVWINKGEVK
jgi:small subunit ribosomal protein S3